MAITAQMRTEISQLYVALFGRAPDGEGLGFWVGVRDAGQSLAQIADAMYATAPARAYYPTWMTDQEIIGSFYLNVLGRIADAEGLAFWTARLNAAGASPGSVITQMISVVANYAGTDPAGITSAALFNNKVEVAQYYGEHLGAIAGANAAIADVSAADASVAAAIAAIGIPPKIFILTPGVDNIGGAVGNDVIIGTDETFSTLDQINGGAGTDTLVYNDTFGGIDPGIDGSVVSNIEIVSVRSAGDAFIDTTGWTGVTHLNITQAEGGVDAIAGDTTAVSVSGASGDIWVDGGSMQIVLTSASNVNAVLSGAAGEVSVISANQGSGDIWIDDGTNVGVIARGVTIGEVAIGSFGGEPTGAIGITSIGAAYMASTGDTTLGDIVVTGGTSVTVNQIATSSSAAAASDTANHTITQSHVDVYGGVNTSSVTVMQSSAVAKVDAVIADGTANVHGVTGVMGVLGGAVHVFGHIAGADVLTTATLSGYGTGSYVESDALTALNLSHSNEDVLVDNAGATSLALLLNAVGSKAGDGKIVAGAVDLGSVYATLNVGTSGADSYVNLTATGTTALNVAGAKALDLTGSTLSSLKTVTVNGSAGLTLDAAMAATLTSVDASGTSGNVTASITASQTAYTGGSGEDTVTLISETVSIALAGGMTSLGTSISGGDGTDTLIMEAADAAAVSANAMFAVKIDGFEKLRLTAPVADAGVDLANLDGISYVIGAGGASTLTLNHMADGGTLVLTDAGAGTRVVMTDATGSTDTFNVVTVVGAANLNFGTVTVTDVETVNLTVTDAEATTINTATVTISDAALKTLNVSGNTDVTLSLDSAVITMLNASTLGGKLIAHTNGAVAEVIIGGTGADTLTANGIGDTLNGGAGADTLIAKGNLVVLTGGAGTDTFDVSAPTTSVNGYTTITDFSPGDTIKFAATSLVETFAGSRMVLAETAVFQDYANAIIASSDSGAIAWFQFGGDTYIVEHLSASTSTTFTNGTDVIVKIVGLVDLSKASFSSSDVILTM